FESALVGDYGSYRALGAPHEIDDGGDFVGVGGRDSDHAVVLFERARDSLDLLDDPVAYALGANLDFFTRSELIDLAHGEELAAMDDRDSGTDHLDVRQLVGAEKNGLSLPADTDDD